MITSRKLFITTLIIAIFGACLLDARIIYNAELEDFLHALEKNLGLEIINVHYFQDYIAIEAMANGYVFNFHDENRQELVYEQEAGTCPICFEKYDTLEKIDLTTPCDHKFCLTCSKIIFEEKSQNCPLCRQEVSGQDFQKMLSDSTSQL